ncbi:MAG: mechanosensitive ion channel [Rhodospirillales bacterium]
MTFLRTITLISVLVAVLVAAPVDGLAQEVTPAQAEATISRLETSLTAVDSRIDSGGLTRDDIRFVRRQIDELIAESVTFRDAARRRAAKFRTLLDALGPPPESGLSEAQEVTDERANLQTQLANSESRAKRADLLITRAELMLRDVTQSSRDELAARLFTARASPLEFGVWRTALTEFSSLAYRAFVGAPAAWAAEQAKAEDLIDFLTKIVALTLAVSLIALPLRRWLIRRFGRDPAIADPSYRRRVLAGLVEGAAHGLFPMAFVGMALAAMQASLELNPVFETVFEAAAANLLIFFFVWGLINGVLPRHGGNWHVTRLSEDSAWRMAWRLKLVMLLFVGFRGTIEAFSWQEPSAELESVFTFIYSVLLYPGLVSLCSRSVWIPVSESENVTGNKPAAPEPATEPTVAAIVSANLRRSVIFPLLAIPVTAAAGYAQLAWFLAEGTVMTGIIASVALLLRWLKNEVVSHAFDPKTAMGRRVRRSLGMSDTEASRSVYLGNLALDALLLAGVMLLLLPVWGFGGDETLIWVAKLFRGIQIGSFTLSLSDVFIAVGLFVVIMTITRLFQRKLETHLLPRISRDVGVRNALRTGVGYVGFIIAALVGIAAIGIDLSNLALVVGALSVGIGFGLQNVVNNFVSGLILLIERPIKQGDWVVVGGHEGTVKSVNVRSTEIETFQKASVIIPNADLIASPVTNWTHKNVQGRVEILVGVAYGSDVEKVRDILLEVARNHPKVMKTPEPSVVFKDFGASSLDFELRCYLSDILWIVLAASDMRFAIDKAFREHGIEIPFPQRVVHMAPESRPAADAPRDDETPSSA